MKLRLFALCLFVCSTLSGCFVFLPLIEQDKQAEAAPALRMHYFVDAHSTPAPQKLAVATKPPVTEDRLTLLINQLKTGTTVSRTHAATDIGYLQVDKTPAVEPLAFALKHDDCKWVRRAAAKALGKIGTSAVIPLLAEAKGDSDKWVAHSAGNALERVQRASR